MAFVRNVNFSPVLSKPAAVSALLSSTLRKVLEEEGEAALFAGVDSICESDGKIVIKTSWPLVASALKLRSGKIRSAFAEILSRFGKGGIVTLRIR